MYRQHIIFIITLTVVSLNIARDYCYLYCLNQPWYQTILNDQLHHYQLGLLLIPLSLTILKPYPRLKHLVLAISTGLVIDESMYILDKLGLHTFTYVHWHGIIFEFFALAIVASITWSLPPNADING